MITSENCYIRGACNKYKSGQCSHGFCQKLYSIDMQYELAQLTTKQRIPIILNDPGGEDTQKYIQLQNIQTNILEFVRAGHNLYISSPTCGTGKTSWALKLLQAYVGKVWAISPTCRTLFINVPRFFIELKRNIGEEREYITNILANIATADLVVWDEIGMKGLTQFESEQLFTYLNFRLDSGKSNIYTSNLALGELELSVGPRLYSRIIGQSTVITFTGTDHRMEKNQW